MPDEIKKIPCGEDFVIVKIDKENKMVKVGPYVFETKEDYFFFDDVAVETKWVKEQTLVFLCDNIAKGLIYKPKTKRERKIVEAVKDDKERVTSKEQAN